MREHDQVGKCSGLGAVADADASGRGCEDED